MPEDVSRQYMPVVLPRLEFLSGGYTALSGGSVPVPVPEGAVYFQIRARGGDAYYAINGGPAANTSGGYVPEDSLDFVGPLKPFYALDVYGAAGGVHIQFFRES